MVLENSDLEGEIKVSKFDGERERENISAWLEKPTFRIAILSTFAALAVVFGYMLAFIPNIEIFTLTIFLSGFILGKKEGLIVGLLSSMIFTFFNPLGPSPIPLLLYQIAHYSLTGFLGGFIRNYLNRREYFRPKEDLYIFPILVILGLTGALITFFYDILSTFFGAMLFSQSYEYFLTTYLTGIIFTTIHLIGNVLGFIFILPGLIQLIIKLLD
jgi:uncharacterized membrane protein